MSAPKKLTKVDTGYGKPLVERTKQKNAEGFWKLIYEKSLAKLTNKFFVVDFWRTIQEQKRGKWILKIAPVCILHLAFVGEQFDERVFFSLLLKIPLSCQTKPFANCFERNLKTKAVQNYHI